MIDEEKYLFELMSELENDDEINLINLFEQQDCDLDDIQKNRMKKNVLKKVRKTSFKHHRKSIIAAAIAMAVIIGGFTNLGKNVTAEILKTIYFIQGTGKVVESSDSNLYVLSNPINYPYKNGSIVVKSITKDSKSLIITLEGPAFPELNIVDNRGNKYKDSGCERGMIAENKWINKYYFYKTPKDLKDFSITLAENQKIPISLINAKGYLNYASLGSTTIKNGLGITMVPTLIDDRIKLNLIDKLCKSGRVSLYGYQDTNSNDNLDILIKDEHGKLYNIEESKDSNDATRSQFYFKPDKGITKFTVQIPQVTMEYKLNKEIKLPIPKTGEIDINKTLILNGFNLKITKVSRQKDVYRVYVTTKYDKNKVENLNIVHVDALRSKNSQPNSSYGGYGLELDQNAVVKYYEFKVNPEDKNMIMQFKELYTNLKGPWIFDLSI